jgi:hypothetical protein
VKSTIQHRALPLVAGAASSYLVAIGLYRTFDSVLTSLGWVDWAPWTPIWWSGILVPLGLLAVISIGIFAAISITIRRSRVSRGVGPFLIGYGALLAAGWLQTVIGILLTGVYDPGWFVLTVWAAFASISALGALLVYRGYRRSDRRADATAGRMIP